MQSGIIQFRVAYSGLFLWSWCLPNAKKNHGYNDDEAED